MVSTRVIVSLVGFISCLIGTGCFLMGMPKYGIILCIIAMILSCVSSTLISFYTTTEKKKNGV